MIPRLAILASLALAACAGGSTMRVSPEDAQGETAVSLAPDPEASPDSTSQEPAVPPPAQAPPLQDTAAVAQGYAPYGNGSGSENAAPVGSSTLDIRRIGQWSHTGIKEGRRMVIQDANAWAEFWSELGVGSRPAVDFSRDVVVAVAAGERSSGGHEIAVTSVTQRDGELSVAVQETVPGPNCVTTSALTQPVDVVVVQGVKPKSWSFVENREVRGCRS